MAAVQRPFLHLRGSVDVLRTMNQLTSVTDTPGSDSGSSDACGSSGSPS